MATVPSRRQDAFDIHTMPKRPHLELYNPDPSAPNDVTFHLFPQLPVEIRLLIWTHALQRHRLLQVTLQERERENKQTPDAARYTLLNALGRPVTGDHYRIIVHARSTLQTNLLHTTRESRAAAEAFYPVKLPCHLFTATHSTAETLLPLNLDWDHLQLAAGPFFPDFLHDLRAHDPAGAGLRRLVLADTRRLDDVIHDDRAIAALQATVRNLLSAWLLAVAPDGGARALDVMTNHSVHLFNYSVPVLPTFTFFDAPRPDPRAISSDLRTVCPSVRDPREKAHSWRRLLRNLGVDPGSSIDVRVMVASGREEQIRTRAEASLALHEEDFAWLRLQWWYRGWDQPAAEGSYHGVRPAGCFATASGLRPSLPRFDGPEVLATAPRPALGFWLFPVEAFGEVPEDEPPSGWLKRTSIFDMSAHWPDLALAHIH